jgi:hypothetical protein
MGAGASSRKGKTGDGLEESDAVLLLLAKHVESGGLVNGTTKVWDLLASLSVEELPSNQEELVCLDAAASAAASLGMMLEKGVISAPVVGGVSTGVEAAAGAPLGAAGEAGVPAVASGAEDATGAEEPAEAAAAGGGGVSGEGVGSLTITGVVDMADLVSAVVAWSEQDDGAGQVPDGGLELSSIVSCDTSTLMALSSTEKNFQIMDPGATIQEVMPLLSFDPIALSHCFSPSPPLLSASHHFSLIPQTSDLPCDAPHIPTRAFWHGPCPLRSVARAVFARPHSHGATVPFVLTITPAPFACRLHVPPPFRTPPSTSSSTPLPALSQSETFSSKAVGLLRDGEVAKVYILDTDGLSISKFITLATLCRFLLKLVQHTDLPADRTLKQMSIGLKPVRVHPPHAASTVWLKPPRPSPPRTLLLVS